MRVTQLETQVGRLEELLGCQVKHTEAVGEQCTRWEASTAKQGQEQEEQMRRLSFRLNRMELAYEELGQRVQTLEQDQQQQRERLARLKTFQTMAMQWIEDQEGEEQDFDDTAAGSAGNVSAQPGEHPPTTTSQVHMTELPPIRPSVDSLRA